MASKTVSNFGIYKTILSAKEFCEIVSSAKGNKHLYFQYDHILMDEQADFGDMTGGKFIKKFKVDYLGILI